MSKSVSNYLTYASNVLTTLLLGLFLTVIIIKAIAIQLFFPNTNVLANIFVSLLNDLDLFFFLATLLIVSNWITATFIGILSRGCIGLVMLIMITDIFLIVQEQQRLYYPDLFTYLNFSDIYLTKYADLKLALGIALVLIAVSSFFKPSRSSKYPTNMLFIVCVLISLTAAGHGYMSNTSLHNMVANILDLQSMSDEDIANLFTLICLALTLSFPFITLAISKETQLKRQIFQSVTTVICIALFASISSNVNLNKLVNRLNAPENPATLSLQDKLALELQHKNWLLPNILQHNINRGIDMPLQAKGIPLTLLDSPDFKEIYHQNANQSPANNVIIIVWNTLSWHDFGLFPDTTNLTAGLAKIAQDGRVFLNTYANGISDKDGIVSIFAGDIPIPPPRSIFDLGDTSSTSLPVSPLNIVQAMNQFQYNTQFFSTENISASYANFLTNKLGFAHLDINKTNASQSKKIETVIDKILFNLTDYSKGQQKTFTVINTAYHSLNDNLKALQTKETDRLLAYLYQRLKASSYFDDGVMLIIGNAPNTKDIHPEQIAANSVKALSHIPVIALGKGITAGKDYRLFSQVDISHNLADLIGYSTRSNTQHSDIIPINIDSTFSPNLNMFHKDDKLPKSDSEQPRCISLHNRIYIDSIWYICNAEQNANDAPSYTNSSHSAVAINADDITVKLAPDQLYQIKMQAEETQFITNSTDIPAADQYIFAIKIRRQSADISSINRIDWLLYKTENSSFWLSNYIGEKIENIFND